MDKQLETDWPEALRRIARFINPLHDQIFRWSPMDYYWVAHQTEWATDTMFTCPRALADIYPALVQHAMNHFASPDVMRFLGKKAHGNFTGELITSFKDRPRRRSGQALGRRQLDQDVRQGRQHPPGGDHHRGHATVQGPAPAR